VPPTVQQQAFKAFEEMCRRRRVTLPPDLRLAGYCLLGIELAINSQVLEVAPAQVASATVYHNSLDRLPEAFPEFRDTPNVFRRAAAGYPSDPEGFRQGVQQAVSRLAQDERFAGLRDAPGVFRKAGVGYPSDPEGFLLARSDIPALRRDCLSWIGQNYVRDETIAAANARLVSEQSGTELVQRWGGGDVASASPACAAWRMAVTPVSG
jgi:hypothetical protein